MKPTHPDCHYTCHHDMDTLDIFCPKFHKWVEACPLMNNDEKESEEDDEEL